MRYVTYSIRTIAILTTIVALGIVCIPEWWTRRIIESGVPSDMCPVRLFEPYVREIANTSKVIEELSVDVRSNILVVTAQARNMDAAKREVQALIADENLFRAASRLQVSLAEIRQLRDEMSK